MQIKNRVYEQRNTIHIIPAARRGRQGAGGHQGRDHLGHAKDKSGISRHIANILKEGELPQETTVAKIATVVNRGYRGEVPEDVVVSQMEIATRNRKVQTLQPHSAD